MKSSPSPAVAALLLLLVPAGPARSQAPADSGAPYPETPATSPEESTRKFHTLHGFRLELIAAEPLVTDPVDIAYDENGRAYVAEMNDYPYTDKAAHHPGQENPTDQPIGKIRLLTDTDGDGVFDQSTVFAEGLSWPTGVVCWKGGIFVTATPDLWWFKDTNGDGVADERRKVYTGFKKLNVQAVMNNPVWGLDNRIHIAGSTNGGILKKSNAPDDAPLAMSRHDLRFDPVTETLELESGFGRFGNAFDDYGNRFVCNIRDPALHVVLPKRYLDRNPHLPPVDPRQDICEFGEFIPVHRVSPPEAWRVERAARWTAEEASKHPPTELVGAGGVTSSAGVTIYRGDAWPEEWRGQLFVADVASNLFYRLKLTPDGMTFKASRPDADADFCASEDVWFRPVNFENAPDGCLHVLDMHREAIEHPWSIPDDIHARIDLRRGMDRGRIYRLVPPGDFTPRPAPRLADATTAELVKLLAHRNAWHRETAQRLIFERQDKTAVEPLRRLLHDEYGDETARLHALRCLEGLKALTADDLAKVLGGYEIHLRTHAVQAAEPFLAKDADVFAAVLALERERDPRLLGAAILAVGDADPALAAEFLIRLGDRIENDPWLRVAALSSAVKTAPQLAMNRTLGIRHTPGRLEYVYGLSRTAGATAADGSLDEFLRLIANGLRTYAEFSRSGAVLTEAPVPQATLCAAAGLNDGLRLRKKRLLDFAAPESPLADLPSLLLAALVSATRSPKTEPAVFEHCLPLLGLYTFKETRPILENLLYPDFPLDVQRAALGALGRFDDPAVGPALVASWGSLSPALKQQALEFLISRDDRLDPLLQALENGEISAHLVTRARRETLTGHANPELAARAKALFSGNAARAEVIAAYQSAIARESPDAEAGHEIFRQFCVACHQAGEEGFAQVGPNLSTVKAWDRDQLLTNILDPNREVSPDFVEYLVEKTDGSVVSGALLNETDAAVLLRRPDGSREAVFRRDIKEVRNSGLSLMPEGLETVLSPRDLANLIAWLTKP
ncbi:MAG: c-type cytochrome [Verrucomicrobiae bacterium]|nr:c-type cytochrome [Verrucomicrobiae bacterium]